jgi:tight adherence protein B
MRGPESVPGQIWRRRLEGEPLAEAIRRGTENQSVAWRTVGASWELARVSGAPLAAALLSLARSVRDHDRTARQVEAELAGPRATMRLVGVLPVLALMGGALGGVDALSFLFLTPQGQLSLSVGLACVGGAWWWMRTMVKRVMSQRTPASPRTDLFLIAVGGGASPQRALESVDLAIASYGLDVSREDQLDTLIALSRRAGVPVATLAREHLDHARDVEMTEATKALGSLSVHLVLPLGLLVLPAFILIAVVPLAWGIANQTVLL